MMRDAQRIDHMLGFVRRSRQILDPTLPLHRDYHSPRFFRQLGRVCGIIIDKEWQDMNFENHIMTDRELEFAVYCIENVAAALGKPSGDVYRALSGDGGILHQYIVPSYDVLHTQGKDYIVNDIMEVMSERGVLV